MDLALTGCQATPLLWYLKALAVLRLVAGQHDPSARGFWRADTFWLRSSLDREGIVEFFLREYRPSPIIAPWGSSGFFGRGARKIDAERQAREALEAIERTSDPRFEPLRGAIRQARDLLKELGFREKPTKRDKLRILRACRARLRDEVLPWLDSCYVLTTTDVSFPPLLGTGGNVGRQDLVSNFLQHLRELLIDRRHTEARLRLAIFAEGSAPMQALSPSQFDPGLVEGPNLSRGPRGDKLVNPWDFVLAMEGSLLFAAAAARRLSAEPEATSFPFTVRFTPAGAPTVTDGEAEGAPRWEIWAPLWSRPATFGEVQQLVAEGRAEVGRQQARDGIDFARAVATMGVDRGITEFVRYALVERSGQNVVAVPLGRLRVEERPGTALLFELDGWLQGFRRFARAQGGREPPQSLASALRRVEDTVFDFCRGGSSLGDVLSALGRAERALARARPEDVRPLQGLSTSWLAQAYDGSPEFRLAASLASMYDRHLGDLRKYLEPIALNKGRLDWARDVGPCIEWAEGSLPRSLTAILSRRVMESEAAPEGSRPIWGAIPATLEDVNRYVAEAVEDALLSDFLWGLSALRWDQSASAPWQAPGGVPPTLPRMFAVAKLLFAPAPFEWDGHEVFPPPELEVVRRLSAGDAREASRVAALRLTAHGLPILATDLTAPHSQGERLASALLFPLSQRGIIALARLVLRTTEREAVTT